MIFTEYFFFLDFKSANNPTESIHVTKTISPHLSRSNSNSSVQDSVSCDYILVPSSPSSIPLPDTSSDDIWSDNQSDSEDEIDYLTEFVCPSGDEHEKSYSYDDDIDNDDIFLETHLTKNQLDSIDHSEDCKYQRPKRSHKKMKAQSQIKTKHAKSVLLDEPSLRCMPSTGTVRLYTYEELRNIVYQHRYGYHSSYITDYSTSSRKARHVKSDHAIYIDESHLHSSAYQFREYTLNEYNIPDESSYDDTMVSFLLEMQNRDLSPEDYEMLLRLDERVQRKTVNTSILDTLPTVSANETHLDDQCTICMETYTLGQELKLLPCKHIFHSNCIETYLKDFSIQCPLDNLPLLAVYNIRSQLIVTPMSDLAETFQNDISQIFNERGLLRTELIAKEKLLTDAILQKNTLSQSLKQLRTERDDLFVNNQKLKQEKLAAEAEKSASTIHVTILKEEKSLLEQKLYQLTQHYEESRVQIEDLNRQNVALRNQKQHQHSMPIQSITDHRHELDELKRRNIELEQARESFVERHKHELQLVVNESNAKDEQIQSLERLLAQYEEKIEIDHRHTRELEQRIQDISQSCRSQVPDKLTLTNEELRTIETDPNGASILAIYRSSKSLFDILVDYARLQKQNETLINQNEKVESQRRHSENHLHQIQSELQQLKVQNERLQFLADSRQTEYEQAIRDKQTLFKEKLDLDRQLQQKLREFDDWLDDRNNMRAQIFNLLENGNVKGHSRSLPPMIDNEILARQGVVTFNSVEELYEQYMKTLADIRETDRFIVELEDNHSKEMTEISQREHLLKENLDQLRSKLDQTRADINIQSLAKQVLDREQQHSTPKAPMATIIMQTDLNVRDLKHIEDNVQQLQRIVNEKEIELSRAHDEMKLIQQRLDYAEKQSIADKRKIDDLQHIVDESLQRSNSLLVDVQTSEAVCEQLREQNRLIQYEYDQLLATVSNLKAEIDKLQIEKQQMSQLQEQVLDRIKQDIETKTASQEENLRNTRLQESVEELNSIMKDCVKQTELTNGTPAHVANLTKLEILYRQLQQRHQCDLEQHFAITESLKIKAKDAQTDLHKLERQCEEMRAKFDEEQMKSAAKVAELESKLRNADTTTVLTRLLPSATLENRLKEEEERTQQLRSWTNKLTEKIEHIQKQMAMDKKEYEEKMEEMRKGIGKRKTSRNILHDWKIFSVLKDTRNEYDVAEKRLEAAQEDQQKCLNEFKEKEEALEMEIFKLKTELDTSQATNVSLKETISIKENDIRVLHERILDSETKMISLEKEFFTLKEKYARQTKDHDFPISEPPSPIVVQQDLGIDDSSLDTGVELKTPGKRRRLASANEQTPSRKRIVRSQSFNCQSTKTDADEAVDDNDDAMSTTSEPPSAKKRRRRVNEVSTIRLPAVDEEGDNDRRGAAVTPTYNLRSRTRRLPQQEN
ncbi:unnamed protein product [Adineta ricciae]|uniref:RING-type domain-containing protein n=1 Tax=Adineta ricciae TaxID=249248 RepID=A0A813MY40_ADIRI|nr:unnamed protein product [Adineta ricciae]